MYSNEGEVMLESNFTLPDDMKFGEAQIIAITSYFIMFIVGLVLNTISLYHVVGGDVDEEEQEQDDPPSYPLACGRPHGECPRYLPIKMASNQKSCFPKCF